MLIRALAKLKPPPLPPSRRRLRLQPPPLPIQAGGLRLAAGLACAIPHFHLKGGIGEYALVLLSIIALFAGASMVSTCFVRNMMRNL